jgi:iron complex transport system ATP-binding protein
LVLEGFPLAGLRIENLSFSYGRRKILENVSLEAPKGKILCLLGPNGVGKSTLLKCLAGIIRPNSGRMILDGRDLKEVGIKDLSKLVGYVPQNIGPVFSTTVFEVILTSRLPYFNWSPGRVDIEKTEEVIKRLGMEKLAFRYTNEISGGEWQKVVLAMALVKEPSLLLLDEPTSNLDLKHQVDVMGIIRELVKNKSLIAIITTHDINLASKYADVVALMKNGSVYAVGEPRCILNEKMIQEVYDVKVEVIRCASLFVSPV